MTTEVLLLSFAAALISLDTNAIGHFMISRPIVCGPLAGFLIGDTAAGLWVGVVAELYWVSVIPMGAAVPRISTPIALLATFWTAGFTDFHPAVVCAFVAAIPASVVYNRVELWFRYRVVALMHWVEEGIARGREGHVSVGIFAGAGLVFLRSFVLYALLIPFGRWLLGHVFSVLDARAAAGLERAWLALPLAGLGVFLVAFSHRRSVVQRAQSGGGQ